MSTRYSNPKAFKDALESRLRNQRGAGTNLVRTRQLVAYDRLLARVSHEFQDSAVLKGGLALELRLNGARTTKDVDLTISCSKDVVLTRFQRAGRLDLGDFMSFEIQDGRSPEIQNDGLPYGGRRLSANCMLAGQRYADPFGIDIAFEKLPSTLERITTRDVLAFAGIDPPEIRIYPVETHIAEKLHAYTMPRTQPNSRVKDLPDLALLAKLQRLESQGISDAIARTFDTRKTHPVPTKVPAPPDNWAAQYLDLRTDNNLEWATIADVYAAVKAFLDPLLGMQLLVSSTWDNEARRWL